MTDDVQQREAEIRLALGRVDDPELDEPVTDLRFVDGIAISPDGSVAIGFRLPTYWCAANFAFLMADDMRREVATLPWVTSVTVALGEHMYADKINHGVAAGLSFQETFGAEADGDLDGLRQTFLVKAFQRRQEALIRHLLAEGLSDETVADLSLVALGGLDLSDDGERLRGRYLARWAICAQPGETLAFIDRLGEKLVPSGLPSYLQALATVGINAEFNGILCRGLLAARFDEEMTEPAHEPTLRDFVRRAANEYRSGESP